MLCLDALQMHLEGVRQHIPPARPRLADALALEYQHRMRRENGQDTEAHGDSVVVVAVDSTLRLAELLERAAVHFNTVIQLVAVDPKLRQLVFHSLDPV